MIYGFARQSGGHVRIESVQHAGTTMRMYLPRSADQPAGTDPATPPPATTDPARGRILLVEDEEPLRVLMVEALGTMGHHVQQAGDAASALKLLGKGIVVDLLVTDIGLTGGMNGRQLAEVARQSRPDLRLLFITGYAEATLVEHGSFNATTQIMTKPFVLGDLGARVGAMIQP